MVRLINEDDVMRMLTSVELNNGTITDAKSELRNVKTAYDISKVVAELEDAKFLMPPENDNHYADNGLFLEDAIDIVKRGGVE